MKKILILILSFLILVPVIASAQQRGFGSAVKNLDDAVGGAGLQRDISVSIGTAIKGVLAALGTIFLILTVYAGVLWMTAAGKEEQIEKAQGVLKTAIIGLAITLSAYAI